MSPQRRSAQPPEFQRLLDRARSSEKNAPRKHHLVPSSYLKRWAEDGRIRVTEVDSGTSYVTAPGKAARETDFYRLEGEGLDNEVIPPLLFETMLSVLEDSAVHAIDALLEVPASEIDSELMAEFVWYLSFQLTRGLRFREQQRKITADYFRLQYDGVSDEWIARRLRQRGRQVSPQEVADAREFYEQVVAGDIVFYPQDAETLGLAGQMAEKAGWYLLQREWVVYETPRVLVTCDEPVVIVGGPGHVREEQAGLAEAAAVVFPLAPHALLVMYRRGQLRPGHADLDHVETADINREVIANASRWAFERPSRRVTESPHPERVRAYTDPADQREIYRLFTRSRWEKTLPPPPWPVERWWR